jgi:hypothetical protein
VTIRPDWSLDTGHDEDLERIAEAFGGGVSCLPALRRLLPALRAWWERAHRRTGMPIRSDDSGSTWRALEGPLPCCPRRFADPRQAAAHARSPHHVAAVTGVPARELAALVRGLRPASPSPPGPPPWSLDSDAWTCGLDPGELPHAAASLGAITEVGVSLMLALAQTGVDPDWVASTMERIVGVARARDPSLSPGPGAMASLAAWLAWTVTPLDAAEWEARADWVLTGTRRADIVALSGAGYRPGDAREVAAAWGLSLPGAAQMLARWVAAGYRPSPAQLAWVQAATGHGFAPWPPASTAVDRVVAGVSAPQRPTRGRGTGTTRADQWDRTRVALALVRWGNVADTVAALRADPRGVVGPPA